MRIGRMAVGQFARPQSVRPSPGEADAPGAASTSKTTSSRVVRRLRSGSESARIDLRFASTGELVVVTISSETTQPLSSHTIGRVLETYVETSATPVTVRTPAITREEAVSFHLHGFATKSVLRLLTCDLTHDSLDLTNGVVEPRGTARLRRGRSRDLRACVHVDRRAFGPENSFDALDLRAALDATDRSRLRVAVLGPGGPAGTADLGPIVGFAVTGRDGTRGYLQRLAVDPGAAGSGIGSALVTDALRWCRARGVRRAVVNTESDNVRALRLYRRLGFVDIALDLLLLERRDQPGS